MIFGLLAHFYNKVQHVHDLLTIALKSDLALRYAPEDYMHRFFVVSQQSTGQLWITNLRLCRLCFDSIELTYIWCIIDKIIFFFITVIDLILIVLHIFDVFIR